jgi:hypothetical protein
MLVSFVVRLVVEDLRSGAITGEVHNVASGEQAIVRSVEDLIAAFTRGAQAVRATLRSEDEGVTSQ